MHVPGIILPWRLLPYTKYTSISAISDFSHQRICRPPLLSFAPIFIIDAHRAESNAKSIFRFILFFSYIWLYLKFSGDTGIFKFHQPKNKSFKSGQIYRKDAQWAKMNEKSIFRILPFFMVVFVLKNHRKIYQIWVNAFLNHVSSLWMSNTKSTISEKSNNRTQKKVKDTKIRFRTLLIIWDIIFSHFWFVKKLEKCEQNQQ